MGAGTTIRRAGRSIGQTMVLQTPQGATSVDRFIVIFPSIVFEALPFIVLGALISGALEVLLPQKFLTRILPRRRWLAIAMACVLGLVFPMCECGVVLVMRRLLTKGLPLGCAVAYMLAAPIINPIVIASTWAAFSGTERIDGITNYQMLSLRVGGAFIIAFIVGMIVNRMAEKRGLTNLIQPIRGYVHRPEADDEQRNLAGDPNKPRRTPMQILTAISEVTLHDFIDITCYLVIGALLASLVQAFHLVQYAPGLTSNPILIIVFMMVLAALLCLCSEADAFVAANLPLPAELALGGKVAFLVLGPMLDLKLYFMYTLVLKKRLIFTIMGSVTVLTFVYAVAVHYLNAAALEIVAK
jgi:uncharacterized membrane protein YraQ (UPF0718 family)